MKNKILISIIGILVLVNVFTLCYRNEAEIQILYNEEDLSELVKECYPANIMIDLRDKDDYESGHISGFINIPSQNGMEVATYLKINGLENKSIYVMCYSGKRSAATIETLRNKGYAHLIYITFGYDEYVDSQDNFVPEIGECNCLAD